MTFSKTSSVRRRQMHCSVQLVVSMKMMLKKLCFTRNFENYTEREISRSAGSQALHQTLQVSWPKQISLNGSTRFQEFWHEFSLTLASYTFALFRDLY